MRWRFASAMILCAGLLGCGDDAKNDEAGNETSGDGDGDPGDGDGDPGDGDGVPGDGDGDPGDGDGEPGDGDGDGDPGDGDGDPGDGDGDPGDGDGDPGDGDGDPGDGDGDPGDGDGDPFCDPSGFLGAGIADDGWGVGDLCDEIYVCVNNIDYDALVALLDLSDRDCMSNLVCGDGQLCTLSYQIIVDEAMMQKSCDALTIVNAVYCVVWGP